MTDLAQLQNRLAKHGQEHLLHFWDDLDDSARGELLADIESIDFKDFARARESLSAAEPALTPDMIGVPESLPAKPDADQEGTYRRAEDVGRQLITGNRVAAMVVAGGQGTRLGFDGPKGAFPIAPISGKCLFQLFAESILATNRRYDCNVPWYVMTSRANHCATLDIFESAGWYGLDREDVYLFSQGMMPATDHDGKILLEERHRVALSPNGHGGSLTALSESGAIEDMQRRGIDHISYFQVDNPLVMPIDPLVLGLHAIKRSQASSLTIGKAADDEKVGLIVSIDGVTRVVEYSNFPIELAGIRDADGSRKFDLANIAVHVFDREFIERIVGSASLPWHRAIKRVNYVSLTNGRKVTPKGPNAVKAEMFVFDALPLAERTMVLNTTRRERFSPVKILTGVDSAETAERDMIRRWAGWLESCGVTVPRAADGSPDCTIEIDPQFALDAGTLREKLAGNVRIAAGERLHLQ